MHSRLPGTRQCTAVALVLLAVTACRSNPVTVRTMAAPNAQFAGRTTFRILPMPEARGVNLAQNDPMLVNSITYQAVRDEIRRDFESRGYVYSPQAADFSVAYYATAAPKLDVNTWDYGYTWRGFPRQDVQVTQYEQGTMIIDAVDPRSHQLLWRGTGVAAVSTDPNKYSGQLRHAVDAIVNKFPSH